MPGWVILIGLAWIVVAVVIIAVFRGSALLSGRIGHETQDAAQRDAWLKNETRRSASPKVGDMMQSSGQRQKNNNTTNPRSADLR